MKKQLLIPTVFFLFFILDFNVLHSQTGPAGVGTNTTSTNQIRFWLKGDAGVYNNAGTTLASNTNLVQQWNDQSGVGNNATQATSGYRPRYVTNAVNGLPAMRFTGGNFVTAGAFPSIASNVGYTYIIVMKDTSFTAGTQGDGAGDYIIDRGLPGAEVNELVSLKVTSTNKFGFQKRDGGGGGLGGPVSTTSVNTGSYQIITYRQTPGTTKVYDLFVDGALENTVSSADADYVPPVPQIGHHYQPVSASGMKGYIAEVMLFNYNLNNAQVYILNSHLAAKYGLTVSNDQYAGDVAGINYDFEVAGIGREASAASINTTASSAVSGGLEATQGTTTFENNEYLSYGHQSGVNGMDFSDITGMGAGSWVGRWSRIWYLDFTHSAGGSTTETVNLTFDVSDGGMGNPTAATATNYKLLYRSGLSGTWTQSAITPTLSGDRITFSGIAYNTFGDGYYTVGTLDNVISPLPIELTRFTANTCDKNVCLDWSTLTESNNDYFVIEKTKDGANFETVAKIDGASNSTSLINYSAIDNHPYKGTSYYRLKQIDFDGNFFYSKLEEVDFTESSDFAFDLFPNPNDGTTINVAFNGSVGEEILVVVYDATGRESYSKVIVTDGNGENIYAIDPSSKLAPGMYLISATSKQEVCNKKMIVR